MFCDLQYTGGQGSLAQCSDKVSLSIVTFSLIFFMIFAVFFSLLETEEEWQIVTQIKDKDVEILRVNH